MPLAYADHPQSAPLAPLATIAAPAPGLTVAQAIEHALTQNPMMQQTRARIAEAQGAIQEADGSRLPRLDLSFGAMGSNNALNVFGMKLNQGRANFNDFGVQQFFSEAGPTFGNLAGASATPPDALNHPGWYRNFQTTLKLSVPIYNGGKIRALRDQAQALLLAAQSGDQAARQQLIMQVVQAYAGIDAANAFVRVTEQAVEAARSYRDLSKKLFTQGVVSKSDLLTAEVNLGDVKLRHQQALDQRANAMDGLRIVTGMTDGEPFQINQQIAIAPIDLTLAQARDEALRNNPQLAAIGQQIDAAQAGVTAARSVYKPQFNLMAQQDWNSYNLGLRNDSYTVGGVLSWQVLDFGARAGQVDRAVAGLNQAQAQQQVAGNQLMNQVGEIWRAAALAEQRLAVKKLAISQSEEATRLENLRYAQGLSTMTNLLQSQAALDKARAEYVSAQYELTVQRASLLLATGNLTPERISGTALPQ
ncbi:TolC family protein [Halothiobacillus sp. DCM-1]|uniref:TolC family protein n=1 Tax=Halothiobacillus sp. DCM-1 TaxID=3112558 RepID=UPI00324B3469